MMTDFIAGDATRSLHGMAGIYRRAFPGVLGEMADVYTRAFPGVFGEMADVYTRAFPGVLSEIAEIKGLRFLTVPSGRS